MAMHLPKMISSVLDLEMIVRCTTNGGSCNWKSVCNMSQVGTCIVFVKWILYTVCKTLHSVFLWFHLLFPLPVWLTHSTNQSITQSLTLSKGDVICDYHGQLISESEGKNRMEEQQEGMSFLFFIKGKGGVKLCIDAQTFPCQCHPDKDTFGRCMNHSGKAFNVKPVVFRLNFPDGPRDTVLFLATRNIRCNEVLMWDYGVRRKSFKSEGMDLEWLDEWQPFSSQMLWLSIVIIVIVLLCSWFVVGWIVWLLVLIILLSLLLLLLSVRVMVCKSNCFVNSSLSCV